MRKHAFIAIPVALALLISARTFANTVDVQQMSTIPQSQMPEYIANAVNSPARPAADRDLDASRKPDQMLAFFGIKAGMKVADLWAGGGYTTELLARTVGPKGKVYSQNIEFPQRFKKAEQAWQARVKEPGMSNVVEITKPFDSPDLLPIPPGSLDAVIINMNYHDMVGRGFDRDHIDTAVLNSLKAGGIYGLVDNRPNPALVRATPIHSIALMKTSK